MSAVWPFDAAYAEPQAPARPRRDWLDLAEKSLCVIMLMMMSAALLGRLGDPEQTGEGAAWLRQMWFPVYGVIGAMMVVRYRRMLSVWPAALLLSLVVGWAFATYLWSVAPDVTFRRAVALSFASFFGLYLAARFTWRELVELLAAAALVLGLSSAFTAVAIPSFGVHNDELFPGAWRGLWFEKNSLGGNMARGALACLCAAIMSPERRKLWLFGAAVCAVLVVQSTSTTALLATVMVMGGLLAIGLMRRGAAWTVAILWLAALGGIGFVALMALNPDLFFSLIGKDATLTGRTGLWEALEHQAAQRPLTGYGYGAFWQAKYGPVSWVRNEINWDAHNADNGWLELRIQQGWIGLALIATCFAVFAARALPRIWRGQEGYWAVLFLALLGLISVSESVLARPNDMTWVVFTAGLAKLMQRDDPAPERPAGW